MMYKTTRSALKLAAVLLFLSLPLGPAFGEEDLNHAHGNVSSGGPQSFPSTQANPLPSTELRQVEAKQTCMMNNKFMGSDQIPIEVAGKTYFGCCPMCAEKLKTDSTARTGVDPVSGKSVDKASAVLGADQDQNLYYFETANNLNKFNADLKAKKDPAAK